MPTAEELKARFEGRLRPGPTDERLAATLGLLPETTEAPANPPASEAEPAAPDTPAAPEAAAAPVKTGATKPASRPRRTGPAAPGGKGRGKRKRPAVRLVTPDDQPPQTTKPAGRASSPAGAEGRAGGGEAGLERLAELFPAPPPLPAARPEPVKVGFPVPVDVIRDVTRLKIDLSRHLGRRLSNHEIGAAAAALLPTNPDGVAEAVRARAGRLGLTEAPPPRRRLVADIPAPAATGLEDLVLAVDETEGVRITKSQLWALAHVLLLERAGR